MNAAKSANVVAENAVIGKDAKEKRKTVAGTVSPELFELVEDYRWTNRLSVSEVVGKALEQFLKPSAK